MFQGDHELKSRRRFWVSQDVNWVLPRVDNEYKEGKNKTGW
jgi:hypothetical protein